MRVCVCDDRGILDGSCSLDRRRLPFRMLPRAPSRIELKPEVFTTGIQGISVPGTIGHFYYTSQDKEELDIIRKQQQSAKQQHSQQLTGNPEDLSPAPNKGRSVAARIGLQK